MELGVSTPKYRNNRTAWRNNSAPSRHAPNAPPNIDKQESKDATAMPIPSDSATVPSKGEGTIGSTSLSLCAAVKKTKNRTRRASALVDGRAIIAR
jgi:hypothetical protein